VTEENLLPACSLVFKKIKATLGNNQLEGNTAHSEELLYTHQHHIHLTPKEKTQTFWSSPTEKINRSLLRAKFENNLIIQHMVTRTAIFL